MIDRVARKTCPGWHEAADHLSRADKVLAPIIERVGMCTLAPRTDYFPSLCQSIVNQQISTHVANVIFGRLRRLCPRGRLTPAGLLELETSALRGAGLSRQKLDYLRGLAEAFNGGNVPVRAFKNMDDEEIIQSLIPVKGIGRWTVEMFLIFVLNRTDVLPVDDLGLRKGVQRAYGKRSLPSAKMIRRIAEPWRPYRSVATWYLWRSLA